MSKEKQSYVYITTNLVNNKKYIGQHTGFIDDKYLGSGVTLSKAINKYGKDNFNKSILEICSKDNLDERERYWIDFFNAVDNENFYNIAEGGQTGDGWRACQRYFQNHPDEAKKVYQANGEKLKNWVLTHPKENQHNIDVMLNAAHEHWKSHPEELKEHMQLVNEKKEQWQKENPELHKQQVEKFIKAGSDANSKPVLCITTNKIFKSISEAARFYNVPQANIRKVLKGERKSAGKLSETGEKLYWKLID